MDQLLAPIYNNPVAMKHLFNDICHIELSEISVYI